MNGESARRLDKLATIERLFREELELDVPSADTDLLDAGLMDSLTFVDLAMRLERTFAFTLSLEHVDVDHFRTIHSITDFVLAQLKGEG